MRSSPSARHDAVPTWPLGRLGLLLLLLATLAASARAEGISVKSAVLEPTEEGYEVSASFDIALNATVLEAVIKGLALHFVTEVEITHPRWYWLDEVVARREFTYRLAYNALTRQYRVGSGALFQSYDTLEEALAVISRINRRVVAEREALKKGDEYVVGVRMRLDVSQLPKPFQLSAITSREWNLGSEWERWKVVP
jgi:uncharacterized protein DUF4390